MEKLASTNNPFPPGASVCAYLRDSGGNNQDLSVGQQRAVVEGWCSDHGYTLAQVFADEARPGGSTVGRDQFDRMVRHFENGAKEAGVIFWDYSRFARNFDDGQFFLSSIRRKGFRVHSLEQQIPPGSIGKVVESLHLWAAEEYRAELGRNVKRGLSSLVADFHAYPRPRIPPGLRKVPVQIGVRRDGSPHTINRLAPDPVTGPRVQLAFEMRAGGRTVNEIHVATHVNNNRQHYRYMFGNEIYRGVLTFGGQRIENFCEPLIDETTWERVQEINRLWQEREWSKKVHPRRSVSSFLLSGLARCISCGTVLVGNVGRRSRSYACARQIYPPDGSVVICPGRYIPAAQLDRLVVSRLLEYLSGDEYLQAIVERLRVELARQPVAPSDLDGLRAKLQTAQAAAARIADALEKAPASETLLSRLTELEGQARGYRAELAKLEAEERKRAQATAGMDASAAQRAALDAKTRLEQSDFRGRQLALRDLIKEIRVIREGDNPIRGSITIQLLDMGIETTVSLQAR